MRFFLVLFFIVALLDAQTAYERDKNLYMQKGCHGCHGTKAEGMHNYPRLANRAKGFLTYKLKRFRSKISDKQQQEMMIPFAVGLSDEDIHDIVTFLYEYKEDDLDEKYDDSFETWGDGGS